MKKRSPNSTHYRAKSDNLFMIQFRGQPCEVCGITEGSCGHHYVSKGRSKPLRYDIRNIIILCPGHHNHGKKDHITGAVIGAHSTSSRDQERFIDWFKATHPDRHQWIVENERIERRYTFKDAVENLKAGRNAWE